MSFETYWLLVPSVGAVILWIGCVVLWLARAMLEAQETPDKERSMSESHDASIGEAYLAGMSACRVGLEPKNPYFQDTQQHAAFESGYRDQKVWMANHKLDKKEK